MKKSISTQDLKANVGEVIDSVRLRGDRYIIERRGKPMAALVPLSVNEAYETTRAKFFELRDTIAERNRDISPEEIEAIVTLAVREVRREKRNKARMQTKTNKPAPKARNKPFEALVREDQSVYGKSAKQKKIKTARSKK